jgi:hypothetical protein
LEVLHQFERTLITRATRKKGCKRGHPVGNRKKFLDSYYRNRKNSGIVDMKKLVEISSNDVSELEARLDARFEARPPKRSKKLQNLPTENMNTPDLPTPDFTARNSPTVVSPQLPSQQYQSQHSIPVPLNGSQIYQQVSTATTQHVQQQPTLPGFQFIRYQNHTPPATPPIQQDDLNLLLQEGLQVPKGQVDQAWFPNAYGGSTANTHVFYNQQGNLSTINMSATNLSTTTHIPQVDGGEDDDEPPILCVRPPNLSSANLSTTKLPSGILPFNNMSRPNLQSGNISSSSVSSPKMSANLQQPWSMQKMPANLTQGNISTSMMPSNLPSNLPQRNIAAPKMPTTLPARTMSIVNLPYGNFQAKKIGITTCDNK